MGVERHLFCARDLDAPSIVPLCGGMAAVFTRRCPGQADVNEDAALLVAVDEDRGLLAVADGMGGLNGGEKASATALESLDATLRTALADGRAFRESILTGFETANTAVCDLRLGAGTTLTVVEIDARAVRTYHVGDSEALVVGQRGRRKLETIPHSPVGYGVEAGLIDEDDALHHDQRHEISNALGGAEMRVDMSHQVRLAARDTLVVASDGVFDNLSVEQIIGCVRKGPLRHAAAALQREVLRRMQDPPADSPSKLDDLTFVVYRPGRGERGA